MSLIKSIKGMDQKFSWSFLGFMMAIIFGSITIYTEFIKENKPDLNYIISSNTSVLDIRETVGSLDVLYHGESLSKNNKDLRLITFEVINQGDTSILPNFYDPNDPVGFSVIEGTIADEPILVEASNSYLEKRLAFKKTSENSVIFQNIILEPGAYFKVKLLILHETSKDPSIQPFGKIAGVNGIDVLMNAQPGDKRPFIDETFGGGLYPNIARFISFSFVFIFSIVAMAATGEKISKTRQNRKRSKLISIFKEYDTDKISEKDNFFFDYYLTRGPSFIARIYELLSDQEKLNNLAKGIERRAQRSDGARFTFFNESLLFSELQSEKFIITEGDIATVDPVRYSVLTDFYNYLKRKGEYRTTKFPSTIHHETILELDEHFDVQCCDQTKAGTAK